MNTYLQWFVLSALTGSPIGSAVALLLFWFFVDRFTLGVLPDPLKWVVRFRKEFQLKALLETNPHDRRARLEFAELLIARRRYARAVDVLKPVLEHGDDDVPIVFVMGEACMGAGYFDQGEKLLAHVSEKNAGYRMGEVDLVLGRGRLARKDFKGAKDALERLLHVRKGSVEGRVLLARAHDGLGDDATAALTRDAAWNEYVGSPAFQRRKDRLWAWRARPSRPLAYGVLLLFALFVLVKVVGPLVSVSPPQYDE